MKLNIGLHKLDFCSTHVFLLRCAESKLDVVQTSMSCIFALLIIFSAFSSAIDVSGLKMGLEGCASTERFVLGCNG